MSGFQRYGDLPVWIFMIILCWLLGGATLDYMSGFVPPWWKCRHHKDPPRSCKTSHWIPFHKVAEFFLCLNLVFNPLSYGLEPTAQPPSEKSPYDWLTHDFSDQHENIQTKKLPKGQPIFGAWSYKILFRFRLNDALQMWVHAVAFMPQCQPKPWFHHQWVGPCIVFILWNVCWERETGNGCVFSNGSLKKKGWNNWSARNPGKYTPWN